MSLQTEINRVSGEVSTQADLLAQISTVLDEKAGGVPEEYVIMDSTTLGFPKAAIAGSFVSSAAVSSGSITILTNKGDCVPWTSQKPDGTLLGHHSFVMPSSMVLISEDPAVVPPDAE